MPEVTEPSQGAEKLSEEKSSDEKKTEIKKESEKLTKEQEDNQFYDGVCKVLSDEQTKAVRGSRALEM